VSVLEEIVLLCIYFICIAESNLQNVITFRYFTETLSSLFIHMHIAQTNLKELWWNFIIKWQSSSTWKWLLGMELWDSEGSDLAGSNSTHTTSKYNISPFKFHKSN